MSSSSSSPTNTTATTTNATETNLAATNTQGVTLVGNKGSTTLNSDVGNSTTNVTYSTDDGTVKQGTALGQLAITDSNSLAESLSKSYADELNTSSIASTNLVSSVLSQGFQFLAGENDTIQNIVTQNQNNQSAAFANYATTLVNIGQAQDTSIASQSTAFATSALKIAAVVVLGIAVIYFATKQG
jgi:hypothetical protein